MAGEIAQSSFFFCTGVATLLYPAGRLQSRWDLAWVVQAAVTLVLADLASFLFTRPEWNGFGPGAWWPALTSDVAVGQLVSRVTSVSYFLMALTLCLVLGVHTRRFGKLERRLTVPVLVAVGAVGLLAAFAESRISGRLPAPEEQLVVLLWESAITVCIPFSLFSVELRRRWQELTVVGRVLTLTDHASAATVRTALREVLGDRELDLALWLPERERYVDTDGVLLGAAHPGDPPPGRWGHQLLTAQQTPLAYLYLADELRAHRSLVDAALRAGARALELAQVQFSALELIREAQQRIVRAEAAERARIERDLHDGAQQRILALGVRLGTLEMSTTDPSVLAQVGEFRTELRETMAELRALAQGIHPAKLTQYGLAAALAEVADRLNAAVALDVADRRWPADLESTLYFTLCEAITNAVKHAAADRITVRVLDAGPTVVGEVTDDGAGGAWARDGGGLAGLDDRIRAMRGSLRVESPPGGGTRLRVEVPCE